MKTHTKAIFLIIAVCMIMGAFGMPSVTRAQTPPSNYAVLAPLPCVAGNGVTCNQGSTTPNMTFQTYVQYAFNLFIALAAVAAVLMIVWGGFEYMMSTIPGQKKDGKQRIQNALVGLLLVLSSYIILRTVDPHLVAIPTTLVPKLELSATTTAPSNLAIQLQNQANQYVIKSLEYGNVVQQATSLVASFQQSLKDVESQIGELLYNEGVPDNDPRVQTLLAKKQDLINKISGANNDVTVAAARQTFNGFIGSAINDAANAEGSVAAIQALNITLGKERAYRDSVTTNLQRSGQYDLTKINNNANYTEARINLLIADQMTKSITKTSTGSWSGGSKYDVTGPDGRNQSFDTLPAAKAYVQAQITKVSANLASVADNSLKSDLRSKIDTTQSNLDKITP